MSTETIQELIQRVHRLHVGPRSDDREFQLWASFPVLAHHIRECHEALKACMPDLEFMARDLADEVWAERCRLKVERIHSLLGGVMSTIDELPSTELVKRLSATRARLGEVTEKVASMTTEFNSFRAHYADAIREQSKLRRAQEDLVAELRARGNPPPPLDALSAETAPLP